MATLKDTSRAKKNKKHYDIPANGLGLLLREAFASYQKNFLAALNEYGVTYSQWRHMWLLLRDERLTPAELSEQAGVKKASSTSVIQSLVERKFIERVNDVKDRRKVHLSLTEDGIEMIKLLSLSGRIINRYATEGIPEKNYAITLKTMRKMIENLDQLSGETQDVLLKVICPKINKR